jgi:hypothetical protein
MHRRTALRVSIIVVMIALILPAYAYINGQGSQTVAQSILKTKFYPSNYNLLGSTTCVSGSLSNLQANDSSYIQFTSYVSATSATDKSDASIVYKSTTLSGNSYPKSRTWTGSTASWGPESQLTDSGSPERTMRVACSPDPTRALDKMVATISNDGFIDVWYFDGSAWTVWNDFASCGTSSNAYQCFDLAYERTSGKCLIVYARGTTTLEIGYRIWTLNSGWTAENTLELPYTTGRVNIVALAQCPATRSGTADDNEIAFICIDTNEDVQGLIWTGSAWSFIGSTAVWDATAAISTKTDIAVAYEMTTGRAVWIWGDSVATHQNYRIWDGATLSAVTDLAMADEGGLCNWISLKSCPNSAWLMYMAIDAGSDLNTAYWDGSAWTVHAEHDADVDTNARRCADIAWESDGTDCLLVWGTASGTLSWRLITPPNTLGAISTPIAAGTHPWVQLRTNHRSVSGDISILGAMLDSANDIGALRWDGTTFTVIGTGTFSTTAGATTYECFDTRFNRNMPTEMKFEVEFLGSSDTKSWTTLKWAIDSSFTASGVTATFQLYNFNSGSYPTGAGSGYMTSTIGATDVTMEQVISTNPTYFKDASGNWRMKITGVLATKACFNWLGDLVRLDCTH